MRTILVPSDFSDASLNAALYAIGFATQTGAKEIVFYHTYNVPVTVTADPTLSNIENLNFDELKSAAQNGLQNFEDRLNDISHPDVTITLLANYGFLTDDIHKACKETKADVIIMGITGGGILTENIIGSDTVIVAREANIPVIIVPSHAPFKPLKKLLLVSDFKDVETTVPHQHIKKLVEATKAELNILNVSSNAQDSFTTGSAECFTFLDLFEPIIPIFNFEVNTDFVKGINKFAEANQADIVLVVPKKHGFFESLFLKSHTKELAFHCNLPLLAVHY